MLHLYIILSSQIIYINIYSDVAGSRFFCSLVVTKGLKTNAMRDSTAFYKLSKVEVAPHITNRHVVPNPSTTHLPGHELRGKANSCHKSRSCRELVRPRALLVGMTAIKYSIDF